LVSQFQTQALLHIAAADPALPVPRPIPTLSGAVEYILSGDAPRSVRLLSYLDGRVLAGVARGARQRRALGALLARLDIALAGFSHPAAGYRLLWDIQHAADVRDYLQYTADPTQRGVASSFLDNFERHALPALGGLRRQVIHNDLNPHNVLTAIDDPDRITGIIDFGDMVQAPLVNDLATAAAYQMAADGPPLDGIGDFIAAYHAVLPLEAQEVDLLYDLVATRMVMTVAITGWRAARFPENRDYILRNAPRAHSSLARLAEIPRSEAQDTLRRLCP
jgi:Ser/Thr protein kinase RdoA (MazF antagonist)